MSLFSSQKSFRVTMADFQAAEKSCLAADQGLQGALQGIRTALETLQQAQINADDEIFAHQQRINELNRQKQDAHERARQLENTLMLLELQLGDQEQVHGAQ